MNLIMNILQRFLQNPKTTLAGVFSGTTLAVAASSVLEQAGCHLDQVSWWTVMGLVFGGPAIVGGASTDNGSTVTPAVPVAGGPLLKSLTLLLIPSLLLTGCASYMPTSDGRYQLVKSAQEPVMIGVSNSYAMLESCKGTQREGYLYEKLDFTECYDLPNTRQHASAPGWFPSMWNGALNLIGFGWVATSQGGVSASASSTATSSATASGGKGH